MRSLRVLLLADTHLGFDLPQRPRVDRRRRGPDFFASTELALAPARCGEVDLVVHGGDLLYRSKVGRWLVERAFAPLLDVADRGVPVILVPGNHERSAIPFPLLAAHPHLHLLDRPRTVRLDCAGLEVAVAGFPCRRNGVSGALPALLEECGWREVDCDVRLLCLHQVVEGARVGPAGFTFRSGADVVRGRDLPAGFAAVLAGHIHRHQVLTRDLSGRPLAAPVLYPGSVERTSTAERDEEKGYLTLEVTPERRRGGRLERWSFHPLPTRPMVVVDLDAEGLNGDQLRERLEGELAGLDPDSVVQLRLGGAPAPDAVRVLRAVNLRALAPSTMTVEVRWPRERR